MGSSVSVEDVKAMDPDVVVVATGARGGTLRADKEDCSVPVFDIFSAMDRPAGEWIGEVAMLGGDHASCHAAQYLARQGVKVHIITSTAALADYKAPITALFLANQLAENDRIVAEPVPAEPAPAEPDAPADAEAAEPAPAEAEPEEG